MCVVSFFLQVPELVIGAGTVLSVAQAAEAQVRDIEYR